MTDFRLVFNGPAQIAPLNSLRQRIAQILEIPQFESLTVVFSSEGGSVTEALSFCGYLKSLPVPFSFHGVGAVSSAAIQIFLSATKRTCEPNCRFFFHAFDYTFPQGGMTPDQIEAAQLVLDIDRNTCKKIVQQNATIPSAELDALYIRHTAPTFIDAQKAKTWGMVRDVLDLNPTGELQPNVAIWSVGW